MKTVNSKLILYILFGASFIALTGVYIWEYKILSSNQRQTSDESRVLWMSHHLDKFQLAYNDALYFEKPFVLNKFPKRFSDYTKAVRDANEQIDSLKALCGNLYVPCDDILSLDSLVKQTFAVSDRVVSIAMSNRVDSAIILLTLGQHDSLRIKVKGKYDEIATHARKDEEIFRKSIENESARRYVLLGLMLTETLLFFGFFIWRFRKQLSLKEIRRKEIEKQLQVVNKAIEQSSASVVITDLKGDIEYVNPAFEKLTGYTFAEVAGQNPRVLKTGYTPLSEYENLWNDIMHCREWRGEFMNKKKNGEVYWENAIISPITNEKGEITNFVAVKENITDKKKLQEEQKHLLAIVENSSAYIFTFDLNRNFLYANKAMKKIIEVGDDDITQYSISQFRSYKAETVTPEVEAALFSNGRWTGETAYKSLSGKVIPVIQVFILHRDEAGNPIYVSATGINISRQKEAENELIHLNSELRTLSTHLQHVREIEKNKIAKEIHDELGQGLAALKLDVSWIKKHLDSERSLLDKKLDEVLMSLSDKLAAFRKIYTSANTIMIEEIGLHASLEYLVNLMRQSGKQEIFFSSNIENEKIPSPISLAVYRIVEESLTNSIMYAGADRVMITILKKENRLIVDLQDNGLEFDLSLRDTQSHYNILEIRERVYAMNGKFAINHIKEEGGFISIEIPLK